jgi:hypothetical protein
MFSQKQHIARLTLLSNVPRQRRTLTRNTVRDMVTIYSQEHQGHLKGRLTKETVVLENRSCNYAVEDGKEEEL